MAQTLIGLFNTFTDAEQAADRLTQHGIARSDVSIHAQDGMPGSGDDTLSTTDNAATRAVASDRQA